MVLPTSGPLSLSQIQTEFGGANPIGMNEYYRGGAYVPSSQTSIPASGTISLSNFYGTSGASWPCYNFYSSAYDSVFGESNWTHNTNGGNMSPPAGSFTFYTSIVISGDYQTATVSPTLRLYRGSTSIFTRTNTGSNTVTLQASTHYFNLITQFSNFDIGQYAQVDVYVRQSNSSGCVIQRFSHYFESFNP